MNYTHKDFKELKKQLGLKNRDIALIIGLTEFSVKNQTSPSKELPTWAKAMLYGYEYRPVNVIVTRQRNSDPWIEESKP